MLKLNRGDQAKQCFMEALALDVKCFEAFDQLVTGEMMVPDEGIIDDFSISLIDLGNRMGICSRLIVLTTNASGCPICATDIHFPAAKIQACQGACADETEAGR